MKSLMCGMTVWVVLHIYVMTAAAQQPGRGFTFADRLHFSGHEPPPFPSAPFRGRLPTRQSIVAPGKQFVTVPFVGFDHPVMVTSSPSVTVIVNVPPSPPPETPKPAEPRLCPWIWTPKTGKQCLEEAFPSQEKGMVLRAPERRQ